MEKSYKNVKIIPGNIWFKDFPVNDKSEAFSSRYGSHKTTKKKNNKKEKRIENRVYSGISVLLHKVTAIAEIRDTSKGLSR